MRSSWRHSDYLRVSINDYRRALMLFLEETCPAAIDEAGASLLLSDLRGRLADKPTRAAELLTTGVLKNTDRRSAMQLGSSDFNRAAESFYRDQLRESHIEEALEHLREDIRVLNPRLAPSSSLVALWRPRTGSPSISGQHRWTPSAGGTFRGRDRIHAYAVSGSFFCRSPSKRECAGPPTREHRTMTHEYIVRETGEIASERLIGDRTVRALYSRKLENAAWLAKFASARRLTELLGYLNYDNGLSSRVVGMRRFLEKSGVDFWELLEDPASLDTARKLFERKIRYWECRPFPSAARCAVCPADSRVTVGSMSERSDLLIKEKFFSFPELLGGTRTTWMSHFEGGDYGVFRLTPEKYHYTHTPVSGIVRDFYAVSGRYHSCNPNATVRVVTPHSKNKRVVTLIDTDCSGGTGIGLVAMIEVVALMIGQIDQRYSEHEYRDPQPIRTGMTLRMGVPKALFQPGSSTVVLLFQPNKIHFAEDLLRNRQRTEVRSRYTKAFGQPLVETDVAVRSLLALPKERNAS